MRRVWQDYSAMELKEFVRSCRRRAKLTQQKLADDLGVDRVTVAAWERGKQAPGWANLELVAAAAKVQMRDCLMLPSEHKAAEEDEAALRTMRDALSMGGTLRALVIHQADAVRMQMKLLDEARSRVRKRDR